VRKRLPPKSTLLLVGDSHAWGLAPFVGQLCSDTGVRFEKDLFPAPVEQWVETGRLRNKVAKLKPHMVMVSMLSSSPPKQLLPVVERLAADARATGATFVWIRPPQREFAGALRPVLDQAKIPSFHSEALELPLDGGQPTVRGYAGWAGALWRWIG
jgi:hypothetical protein